MYLSCCTVYTRCGCVDACVCMLPMILRYAVYLTWMPDCGAPVRIVTCYAVEFLAVYMLMSTQ
jgi:hypothetical protein